MNQVDAIIIGGGPTGLAVAHNFMEAGLSVVVFEKGPIANHISQYPHSMRFFSTNENLEIAGFPLQNNEDKPTRRDYLLYLNSFVKYNKIPVRTYTEVTNVQRRDDGVFEVATRAMSGETKTWTSRAVVVAVGAFDNPRKLTCPGADLPKVHYRFTEPHPYVGHRVLVVGGRSSAIETALILFRNDVDVSFSYRGTAFTGRGVKYWLRPDIENRIERNEITGYLGTNVTKIGWRSVELTYDDGRTVEIENDFVIPCLGYNPPVKFLEKIGIELAPETCVPTHNEDTLETNIPGLFVSGVIVAGNISGHIFIENSRVHGEMMLPRVLEILEEQKARPTASR